MMVVRGRSLSGIKKFLALLTVSVLAATVMPTASQAEGEDAPSGDFTVNVYAELEAFGDPCEGGFGGGSSLSISVSDQLYPESSPGETTEITLDETQGVRIETYPGGEGAANLENLLALHFIENPITSIPGWEAYPDGTASYDNQFETLDWDIPLVVNDTELYGDIIAGEFDAYSYELSLPRQTIYAPWQDVSFDADSCDGSNLVGVLTVARSDVMYEAPNEQPISVEADWAEGYVLDTSHNERGFFGTGKLISFTDLLGFGSLMPQYPANIPASSAGAEVTSVGFEGEQGYGTKVDVFGASPAGGYYMEVKHRLYVDAVQYSLWTENFLSD
jgi:hypothetical protein